MQIERPKRDLESHKANFPFYLSLCLREVLTPILRRAGAAESWFLRSRLTGAVRAPVYVTGLARGGTTITLDLLASHPSLASHRYVDIHNPFMPYFWTRWMDARAARQSRRAVERPLADGILVTPQSPENAEEIVWNAYFPRAHEEDANSVLGQEDSHEAFGTFYRDLVEKYLLARGAERYLSKSNYSITRMEYLLKLFPDARFVIMLRNPLLHVAGLVSAHVLFEELTRRFPKWSHAQNLMGHWDFGPGVRFLNVGDGAAARARALLERGELVEAYGQHWASVYGFVMARLAANAALRQAACVVRHEDLCLRPGSEIARILEHCELDRSRFVAAGEFEKKLKFPNNYSFTMELREIEALDNATGSVAEAFGYSRPSSAYRTRQWFARQAVA